MCQPQHADEASRECNSKTDDKDKMVSLCIKTDIGEPIPCRITQHVGKHITTSIRMDKRVFVGAGFHTHIFFLK